MKALSGVLFIIVCVLAAMIVTDRAERAQLGSTHQAMTQEVEAVKSELATRDRRTQSLAKQLQDARAQLETANRTIDRLDARSATRAEQPQAAVADEEKPDVQSALLKALGGLMDQPEMKAMMEEQQRAQTELMYAAFFEQAGLDKTTDARVRELLAERQMAMARLGTNFMRDADDEDGTATEDMAAMLEAFNAEMKEELGEDYEALQTYEASLPDRMSIDQLQMRLGEERLDAETHAALLEVMVEERQAVQGETLQNPQEMLRAAQSGDMTQYTKQMSDMHARVNARSSAFLSEKQSEVLRSQQKMETSMIKMSVMMMDQQPQQDTQADQ
jgi:hypothetical protein